MEAIIKEIISKFGGRYNGSQAEKAAQEYMKAAFSKFCDKVEMHEFKAALEGHFQALKLFVIVHLVSLVLLKFAPLAAMLIGLVNTVLFLGHFVTYRHWLDFLFPKERSYNVIGDIAAEESATSTIIFAGHIDSVKEFKWWFSLKQTGVVLTVIASFSIPVFGLFSIFFYFFPSSAAVQILWYLFISLSPTLIVLFDMHGKEVVHGANDNLTGIALSHELGKHFATHRPKNTNIRIISFGAEESGLRGAFAYVKANKKSLLEERALLINIDTIKDENNLTIASNELNTLSFFDKDLIKEMQAAFSAERVPVKTLPLTVGASDASAFIMNGVPALSLIGMTTEKLDPTYHTRLDNMEHLDPKAMETLKKVLIRFVEHRDKQ